MKPERSAIAAKPVDATLHRPADGKFGHPAADSVRNADAAPEPAM
jgi:hypothetical protein